MDVGGDWVVEILDYVTVVGIRKKVVHVELSGHGLHNAHQLWWYAFIKDVIFV